MPLKDAYESLRRELSLEAKQRRKPGRGAPSGGDYWHADIVIDNMRNSTLLRKLIERWA